MLFTAQAVTPNKSMTATEHNNIIGILHLVEGGLQIVLAVFLAFICFGAGYFFRANVGVKDSEMIGTILLITGLVIAPVIFILSAINIIAGWKMLKEKGGARTWGIIASIICLFNIPFGTALGVYGLWFLYGVEGKEMYPSDTK
ncbi:hypothetical protein BH10ACI1_BH10ACI1_27020 [soil metagenome]